MDVQILVDMLESNWNIIRSEFGTYYDKFVKGCYNIIFDINNSHQNIDDEVIIGKICQILGQHEYGRLLLQQCQIISKQKLLSSPNEVLNESENQNQLYHRLSNAIMVNIEGENIDLFTKDDSDEES